MVKGHKWEKRIIALPDNQFWPFIHKSEDLRSLETIHLLCLELNVTKIIKLGISIEQGTLDSEELYVKRCDFIEV